ncbi:hypothetical protein G3I60_40050 [Streptomyces sp. SID13666]|uniref:hypothetical protein n=1 Tax=unclassified Streptomyces TaxID=2593676 RepID=UPI0013BEF823|nr:MULTISPECIES: hypothetical protein [unclassified Streptomyces]MCZ4101309.1 hypothetical protein [Streptomyces sp. H39-C1]NEA60195.1 hypothetical protein [Streptomyces sp. SID13666]
MSDRLKPSSADGYLGDVFGAPVTELYAAAVGADAPLAMTRALELRSFLAVTEEQVARVRDRVHEAMGPDRDMGELSADDLRFDAQWLQAALDARDGYRAALGDLLHTLPPPGQQPLPARLTTTPVATTLPTAIAAPAPQRAGATPARRS